MHEKLSAEGRTSILRRDLLSYVDDLFAYLDIVRTDPPENIDLGLTITSMIQTFNERYMGWESTQSAGSPLAGIWANPDVPLFKRNDKARHMGNFMLNYPFYEFYGLNFNEALELPVDTVDILMKQLVARMSKSSTDE